MKRTARGWRPEATRCRLPFHVPQVPAAPQEALEDDELLTGHAAESPDAELALDGGAAVAAAQTGHAELVGADGAGGDHVMWHGWTLKVACLIGDS